MDLYMEIEFIDSDEQGRKTGHGAAMKTNKETKDSFLLNKAFEADSDTCQFLLDLKDRDDADAIIDTICLNANRVKFLIGESVKSEEEYKKYDTKHWETAQAYYDDWKQKQTV